MAFTTWTDLKADLLNVYAEFVSGKITFKRYSVNVAGNQIDREYTSADQIRAELDYVSQMAATESNPAVGRTYAKNGRRF